MSDRADNSSVIKEKKNPYLTRRQARILNIKVKRPTRLERQLSRTVGKVLVSERKKELIQKLLNESKFPMNELGSKYEHVKDSKFKRDFIRTINGDLQKIIAETTLSLQADSNIDENLLVEFMCKQHDSKYKDMQNKRTRLPVYKTKNQLLQLIEQNQVIVISGETGCGKTTQVAQFILDDYLTKKKGSSCKIICTQPRRISALSVAERVADERNEELGESVGYHIRLESVPPRDKGSITFCTTGVVLKFMESDPCLTDVSHLILDEIHERDVLSDFLITIIRDVIKKRKDLKLILMSATLNSKDFSKYYYNCPHIKIPGFTYPVKEYFLEDAIEHTGFRFPLDEYEEYSGAISHLIEEFELVVSPYARRLHREGKYSKNTCNQIGNSQSEKLNVRFILELISYICRREREEGALLVFLPGFRDIATLHNLLQRSGFFPSCKFVIFPLHSQMPTSEQKQIFLPAPRGKRKIILSTNIAETSVTIDDVVYVIDCGKIKMTDFIAERNQQTLNVKWVCKANANQRKGRAGRVKPGVCYHLFSKVRESRLEPFQKPEILRKRLEDVILQAKMLQLGKMSDFLPKLMDPPEKKAIQVSLALLKSLNALDENESLTPLGYHLAKLPVGPQMGKMIVLAAVFSCINPILAVAASLSYKDPFKLPLGQEKEAHLKKLELSNGWASDHLVLFQALEIFETTQNQRQFCSEYFLSFSTLQLLHKMKEELMQYLYEMKFVPCLEPRTPECNVNSMNFSLVKAIICAGLYPNVGINERTKKNRSVIHGLDGVKLEFHPKSILKKSGLDSPLFVYYLKMKSSADFVHDATMVHVLPVIFFGDKLEIMKNQQNQSVIKVYKTLIFKCSETTGSIIKELREKLNWFLGYKISHPGYINWELNTYEIQMLRAIMELITNEDLGDFDSDCLEDDE